MKINVVLCWLTVAVLVAGCATGKNEKVKGEVTIGKPYVVKKFILPTQRIERLPFLARKAQASEHFSMDDLVPAMAVSAHLEVLAKIGRVPIRVREGFLTKEKGQWLLLQETPEGIKVVPYLEYYVVDLHAIVN